ncbi:DUF3726 domain-containing protein [Enterovibrio coralii]|uniref:DUF3726 domain-containing protein n=1 Tax=Enterovibrio coralii TaxID=294935 RepID=A0A135IBS4_9GAMM|nr:DUF3726 domain-containing protein [Enterovibrio coralii]KXF82921.1 hypothetical protein ATN88_03935 [Enterovibrio coralii]
MFVSHNELVTLCAKAFESLQKHCGESDAIANMVVELEMAGLGGVANFVAALQFLDEERKPVSPSIVIDLNHVEADLHGTSLLCHFPALLDVTIEQLISAKSARLTIHQCSNRHFAFGELVKLSGKGISVRMTWCNDKVPLGVEYIHNAGRRYPDIYFGDNQDIGVHDVEIELSLVPFIMDDASLSPDISAEMQAISFQRAWECGIEVDEAHWLTMKAFASRGLVENSEQSQRGAGE